MVQGKRILAGSGLGHALVGVRQSLVSRRKCSTPPASNLGVLHHAQREERLRESVDVFEV